MGYADKKEMSYDEKKKAAQAAKARRKQEAGAAGIKPKIPEPVAETIKKDEPPARTPAPAVVAAPPVAEPAPVQPRAEQPIDSIQLISAAPQPAESPALQVPGAEPALIEQSQAPAPETLSGAITGQFERPQEKSSEEKQEELNWALFQAARSGDTTAVQELLDKGADVDARRGAWQETALMMAAVNGQTEAAEILIAKGADLNMTNDEGKTALDLAIYYDRTDTAELLRRHGAKESQPKQAETKPEQDKPKEEELNTGDIEIIRKTGAPQIPADALKTPAPEVPKKVSTQKLSFRNKGDSGLVAGYSLKFVETIGMFTLKFELKGKGVKQEFELGSDKTKIFTVGECKITVKDLGVKNNERWVEMSVEVPGKAQAEKKAAEGTTPSKDFKSKEEGKLLKLKQYAGNVKEYVSHVKDYSDQIVTGVLTTTVATVALVAPGVSELLGVAFVPFVAGMYVVPGGLVLISILRRRKEVEEEMKITEKVI
ncbi:ankyrin repeat domain-containing protein [Candidatus Micrarchaeota archaeon]|nr:ankyrin repeat domain-containing protein [Candidatus Micrarchaeota archaeon]